MVIYVAYNTKLYKSTGSGWDEVRVASEWGLIANKPSTFTPTAHTHPEYVSKTQLSASTSKRYLIGSSATSNLNTLNANAGVYMQDGELYSNSQKVWNKGSLTFEIIDGNLHISTTE